MSENNRVMKMFQKKDNSAEDAKNLKMKKIGSFFKHKRREFFAWEDDVGNNVYLKPYAEMLSEVDFGESIRELRQGDKERALKVLNQMIEKAIKLDPSWPDIKEMQEIVKYIEEATREDLEKIEGINSVIK